MSQVTSWSVANAGGAAVRAAMNGIFGAIQTASSGATAPSPTAAGMFWFDTSATPAVLKARNAANTAWVVVNPETLNANTLRGNPTGSAAAEQEVSMSALKTMLGLSQSLGTGGYQVLPSGLILQWGITGAIAQGGGNALTFPLTFPTAIFMSMATPRTSANNTNAYTVGTRAETTSGMTVTNNSGASGSVSASWFALGN